MEYACFWRMFIAFVLAIFGCVNAEGQDCGHFDISCHLRKLTETFVDTVHRAIELPQELAQQLAQESEKVSKAVQLELQRIVTELYKTGVEVTQGMLQQVRMAINSLVDQNPYYGAVANVRTFTNVFEPGDKEKEYIRARLVKTRGAIERLTGVAVAENAMPRVGICCSGGGFRAMCAFAGALAELEKQGVLDAALYVATLSGATWAVAPWAITDLSYQDFVGDFKKRASKAVLGVLSDVQKLQVEKTVQEETVKLLQPISSLVADVIVKKFVLNDLLVGGLGLEQNFGGVFSVIDLYGILLGASLFSKDQLDRYQDISLASMVPFVENGQKPLPIFTAVHPHDKICDVYDWYEFSPFEVASYASQAAVAAWAWGRPFRFGSSVAYPSPISLGECMAIWGSAFSVSLSDVYKHNFLPDGVAKDLLKGFIEKTSETQLILAKDIGVDVMACTNRPPFGVSWENNFMYKLPGHLSERKQIPFVDAGIDFGVPVVPLMYRDLDLIIVFDVAESKDAHEFLANEDYARRHGLPFPEIDRSVSKTDPQRLAINERVYSVFDDGPGAKSPIVVYLPLTKNPNYPAFDPRDKDQNKFLNTFNLRYTPEQIDLLSGLYAQGVRDVTPEIKNLLRQIANRKHARNQTK